MQLQVTGKPYFYEYNCCTLNYFTILFFQYTILEPVFIITNGLLIKYLNTTFKLCYGFVHDIKSLNTFEISIQLQLHLSLLVFK